MEAHRPSTCRACHSAIRAYVAFMMHISVDYKRPSPVHICWYIEYLAKEGRKAPTIKNHISHLGMFFTLSGRALSALHSHLVINALCALSIILCHVPNLKIGAAQDILQAAMGHCSYLDYPEYLAFAISPQSMQGRGHIRPQPWCKPPGHHGTGHLGLG